MLTNGSRQPGQLWWGREDRGLCKSLAPLNLMLTDSNEDGLLARIENRRARSSLYLSRPLIKASVHTHVLSEIQTIQACCVQLLRTQVELYTVYSVLASGGRKVTEESMFPL